MSELVIRLPADADRRLTEAAKRLALGRRQLARALLLAVLDTSDAGGEGAGGEGEAGASERERRDG